MTVTIGPEWTIGQGWSIGSGSGGPPASAYYMGTVSSTYDSNNNANDSAVDSAGNTFYVGPVTVSNTGSYGLLLTKFNNQGILQWQRQLIGPGNQTTGSRIVISSTNDIYVAGYAVGGDGGAILVKYNTSGTLQWQKGFNGNSDAYGNGLDIDTSDNLYLGIQYYISGQSVAVLNKYDSAGTLQWTKQLSHPTGNNVYLNRVIVDSSSNAYTVGQTQLSGNYSSVQLAKYNTSGTLQWQQELFTNFTSSGGAGIALDSLGNIYVCGQTDSDNNAFKYDMLLAKLNSSGTVQWSRRLTTGTQTYNTFITVGQDIAIDSLDNIYICGQEKIDPPEINYGIVAKYDTSGSLQWQRTITGNADIKLRSINVDSNSTLYITGAIAPGNTASNGGSWLLLTVPSDGSLTGTYTDSGISIVYASSSLNSWTGSLTSSASSLVDSTGTGNASVTTLTASTSTYTVSSTEL
jgi:hypothetical protein